MQGLTHCPVSGPASTHEALRWRVGGSRGLPRVMRLYVASGEKQHGGCVCGSEEASVHSGLRKGDMEKEGAGFGGRRAGWRPGSTHILVNCKHVEQEQNFHVITASLLGNCSEAWAQLDEAFLPLRLEISSQSASVYNVHTTECQALATWHGGCPASLGTAVCPQ